MRIVAPHDLTVSITFTEETLFERTVTLDAGESTSGSFENPDTADSAGVRATLDDESPTTDSVRVGPGTGIRSITVTITEEIRVEILAVRT